MARTLNDIARQLCFAILTLVSMISTVNGQNNKLNKNIKGVKNDSLKFKLIQNQMEGCWKSKHYQFKYDKDRNIGSEYKSKIHSSAPIFNLKIVGDEIFIEWFELTGGGSVQEIQKITNKRLTIKNEKRKKVNYKRIKNSF
jgi:hypothetical protein